MAAKIDKTYVVNCLVAGFSPSQVAEALGVTPSAMTQFLESNEDVVQLVASKRTAKLSKVSTIDDRLDDIEDKAWRALEKQMGFIQDPMKLLKVAMTANAAKRRGSATPSQEAPVGATATLHLPTHLHQHFHFNAQNQAIAIGDTPLVTMPASQAKKLLDARAAEVAELKQVTEEKHHEAHSW